MMQRVMILTIAAVLAYATATPAADILAPGDPILAFDSDIQAGGEFTSDYPDNEAPFNVLDSDSMTKYLNFGKENSGYITTPEFFGPSTLKSMQFTTANDWPARDPDSWELYGTNESIMSVDDEQGFGESWTLIASGAADLPGGSGTCFGDMADACTPADARFTPGPVYSFPENSTSYTSYKVLIRTVKDTATANSMQVADVNFYESADGTGFTVNDLFDDAIAFDEDLTVTQSESDYPGGEAPAKAIDGLVWDPDANSGDGGSSKYLNFGKQNSGFIVTPSAGTSTLREFEMWTANDGEGRDPLDYEIYGTNDAICSADNSVGDCETWTLIDFGALTLPADRNDGVGDNFSSGPVTVNNLNDDEYSSYKFIVKTLKDAEECCMQFAEIQFRSDGPPCDLDGDSDCDTDDIRVLYDRIDAGTATNDDIPTWLTQAGTENGKVYKTGDTDLDGNVGGNDFTELALNFGKTGLPDAYWDKGNFLGNAGGSFTVGGGSFTQLALNFGHTSVSAVPEPGAFGMLLTVLLGLVGLARSRR